MQHTVTIEFTDGTTRTVESYRTYSENGVLHCRTSHNSAYTDTWQRFPLVNIKTWSA